MKFWRQNSGASWISSRSTSDRSAPPRGRTPKGGYFITLEAPHGTARQIVKLAKEAGVELTPAGATHPLGHDPHDSFIRIAPSFPELPEVEQAAEGVVVSVLLAAAEARTTR